MSFPRTLALQLALLCAPGFCAAWAQSDTPTPESPAIAEGSAALPADTSEAPTRVEQTVALQLSNRNGRRMGDIAPSLGIDQHAWRGMPYTAGAGRWNMDLARLAYGVHDQVEVSTIYWLDVLASPNAAVKWRFVTTPRFSASASTGFTWINSRPFIRIFDLEGVSGDVFVIPIFANIAFLPAHNHSIGLEFQAWLLRGSAELEGLDTSAVTANTFSLGAHYVLRTRTRIQFETSATFGVAASTAVVSESTVYNVDGTTVTVYTDATPGLGTEDLGYRVDTLLVWRFQRLHLGLGATLGNLLAPGVPLKFDDTRILPRVALSWSWGRPTRSHGVTD